MLLASPRCSSITLVRRPSALLKVRAGFPSIRTRGLNFPKSPTVLSGPPRSGALDHGNRSTGNGVVVLSVPYYASVDNLGFVVRPLIARTKLRTVRYSASVTRE